MSKTTPVSGAPRKQALILITEEVYNYSSIESFLKFSALKFVVVSGLPPTPENFILINNRYRTERRVVSAHLNNSIPKKQYDFAIFGEHQYEIAKAYAGSNINIFKVIVLSETLSFENENNNFRVCNWQMIHEYVRTYLGAPEKKSKQSKSRTPKGEVAKMPNEVEQQDSPPEVTDSSSEDYPRDDDDRPF
jgi:hypothetical protein